MFRYVLDYLRNGRLVLPERFRELRRLELEAEFFRLSGLSRAVHQLLCGTEDGENQTAGLTAIERSDPDEKAGRTSPGGRREAGFIVVGYRGTFAFGRDGGIADVRFRKVEGTLYSRGRDDEVVEALVGALRILDAE